MTSRTRRVLGVVALACVPLSGCARGCTSSRPPIHLNPSMDDQPKVRPQTASSFFFNGASMREPVAGTVPIGGLKEDAAFFTGKGADGQFVATIPQPVDDALDSAAASVTPFIVSRATTLVGTVRGSCSREARSPPQPSTIPKS